ncbi:hypothetical protein SCLCIDRAFT_1206912 [Scleroderma citrinum Foug A]|uniref:Uncharacterized protein n=1 Tax=Scleroderma citrinum Foug A TaxID=1036808 RepID=A0A0C3ERJ5_9AGAM|nr:hypothetical protein SCLCIDRAFT_1206912 [Scleroderma citrinum Foug A]
MRLIFLAASITALDLAYLDSNEVANKRIITGMDRTRGNMAKSKWLSAFKAALYGNDWLSL